MKVIAGAFLCALIGLGNCQLPANQEDPCKSLTGVVSDTTYCDRYWECVDNVAHHYDCPNGLVYVGRNRGIAEGCDYPWRGSYCQSRTRLNVDKQRANPPISTQHCDWLYGIFGHETSCTRYWTCWNGTSTEQFCIGGLLYNEETHACDWPQNVEGCQKHPLCRDDPNANVPLGQSCERYWSCQGGYPRLQRCPATLVFDKLSRRCIAPPTADCDVPPPPPIPVDEGSAFRTGGGPPRGINPNRRRGGHQGQIRPRPQPVNQHIQEEVIAEQPRPAQQPRRPSIGSFPIGALPAGAIPINFSGISPRRPLLQGSKFRPAPIEGAIPLN